MNFDFNGEITIPCLFLGEGESINDIWDITEGKYGYFS